MFPTGVLINIMAVAGGGLLGAAAGHKLSGQFKTELTGIFGICAMTMGINAIVLMENMPAVIFSVIVGTALGIVVHLGELINKAAVVIQKVISHLSKTDKGETNTENSTLLVTVIVLFCASGTGIYGCIDSGMTGNHTILLSKSIMDFFSALIFACQLGPAVSVVAVLQMIVFLILFFFSGMIYPMASSTMINDFKACGGVLLLATGFRMLNLKSFPIADMIPAMALVMPCSWLWTNFVMPYLQ
ncbi:DUF554 domain-containing protein [Lachnoclostridium edouardi]|uniref:DUF554 domain-containing protein n=1 Tax=Lachnoclostridium edouardi TaxID=1926283 RepID=UPI000C7A0BB8|nr:DUF554 domain-containing protein [Lachnoclostridium edouardi]